MPDRSALATRTRSGLGRVLIAVYAVFALAATARTLVQVVERFEVAPLAFTLSGVAALVYCLATAGLARGGRGSRRVAWLSCTVELVGVLAIGTLSWVRPEWFPEATVWSHFGQGYGFVPVLLPVLGLLWLRRTASPAAPVSG
ncbi:hypothetical protein GC722_05855 [Auraticoccus sp. F435]|uniref:Integral membrane protein n=1 Tax=Auraticoccus cholistanensis TaxID=2656650 RepID=A0A6A9URZ2_9ACTN|nr:hypothetical protein [Auraticoccus cholistanensis]MVA75553.1 hypothetical protein [Auraticoccus cholistanensis]